MSVLARWLPHRSVEAAPPPTRARAPRPSAASTVPVVAGVDVETALARVNGKAELLWRLLAEFRTRHRDSAASLRTWLKEGQRQPALELAHALKGAGATLGAVRVAEAAREIEAALRDEKASVHSADPPLEELADALAELAGAHLPQAAVPAPVRNRQPAASKADSAAALERLDQALASNSFKAASAFASWRAGLGEEADDPRIAPLGALIDALDYPQARKLIADLKVGRGNTEDTQ